MLSLQVNWLASAYEATVAGDAEWPPHPARVFCALVSVADPGSADDEALRWLESQAAPEVQVPPASSSRRQAYVVTNVVDEKGGHQSYLGRTSGSRSWSRTLPARPVTRVVWPAADPAPELLARLDHLARRVPYIGRSTSPALLAFSADPMTPLEGFETWVPDPRGRTRLRAPHRGLLDHLRAVYADPLADRPAIRLTPYRAPGEDVPVEALHAAPPAWSHLITLGFQPGDPVDGRHAVAVAGAFKAAVLSRLGSPRAEDEWEPLAPEALELVHGHYDHRSDRRRQCATMALPFAGYPHANGDLLGVGLAVSPDLATEVRTPLLRLFGYDRDPALGPRLDQLNLGGRRQLRLRRGDGRRTVDPARWTEEVTRWHSVLPIVLDRFPRRRYSLAEAVADGCEWAGFDRPASVDIRPVSAVAGAPRVTPSDLRRPDGPTRPFVHATLTFPRPVRGPVIVGHLRHLGLGLCLPADTRSAA